MSVGGNYGNQYYIHYISRCGIVPLDRNSYPTERFNSNLKRRYVY